MKYIKNKHGYALVIVLLVIVLFLGISATFIAGSLNHAAQEKTVDTSNHAVAAAEMGTLYFTSDFERELKIIKQEVSEQTQLKLNELIDCIKAPMGTACDTPQKRTAWEQKIDGEMRTLYINEVLAKVNALNSLTAQSDPFSTGQIDYSVQSAVATNRNADKLDVNDSSVADKKVKSIEVKLDVIGTAESINKDLTATFDINVPDTFLNADEALKVDTILIQLDEDLTYEKIFTLNPPTKSCATLLAEVKANTAAAPYECVSKTGEKLNAFITDIKAAHLDPKDFRVYTTDFTGYVCTTNCNNLDFQGISIVVQEGDANAFNNMNNLVNANLIINGKLDAGNNLINLGKNGVKQTIIVKELSVDVNIKNLYYTNFLVLGYENPVTESEKASIDWKNHIEVSNFSHFCIDIDRISQTDLDRLSKEIEFSEGGKLSYYSKDPSKTFTLKNPNGTPRTTKVDNQTRDMTALYVVREDTYSTFLKNCGVTLKNTKTVTTDVSVPNPINTDFDFEVEY
ncbi:hypothetical protein HU147_08275 [Planomicrobium chinense]|uniref:hypothetical protein n=1 Tax=Planococcus chinensis TaxID=272917 RepID=UPI001CC627C4|nr:hypothetical protein [Planococcus chinensis]MBZ5201207.1 hypothetical protein [Planococcus chinensis]